MGKIILGVVLSIVLVYGSVELFQNLDLFHTDAMYDDRATCAEISARRPEGQRLDCWGPFREQRAAADTEDMVLGGAIGLALAGLGWLIAWFRTASGAGSRRGRRPRGNDLVDRSPAKIETRRIAG